MLLLLESIHIRRRVEVVGAYQTHLKRMLADAKVLLLLFKRALSEDGSRRFSKVDIIKDALLTAVGVLSDIFPCDLGIYVALTL